MATTMNAIFNPDSSLTTGEVSSSFTDFIEKADAAIEKFISDAGGELDLSASQSLQLQKLMTDQSIAAQTGTSTLKTLKDSIIAAARNI